MSVLKLWNTETQSWDSITAIKGDKGIGITSVIRTSGNGNSGTTDIYTITFSDSSTSTFSVYNGADGSGAGDMLKTTYDPDNNGKFSADIIEDGATNKTYTALEKTKLSNMNLTATELTLGNFRIKHNTTNGTLDFEYIT